MISLSNNEGRPSDLNYALESLTQRAFARARYQGLRPLPAALRASRESTRKFHQRRSATARCFPQPPESRPKP